jgi:hypothetical protein
MSPNRSVVYYPEELSLLGHILDQAVESLPTGMRTPCNQARSQETSWLMQLLVSWRRGLDRAAPEDATPGHSCSPSARPKRPTIHLRYPRQSRAAVGRLRFRKHDLQPIGERPKHPHSRRDMDSPGRGDTPRKRRDTVRDLPAREEVCRDFLNHPQQNLPHDSR